MIVAMLAVTNVSATEAPAIKDKPQVLLMMSSHASKPKGELLTLLAKDMPFDLVNFSTKGKSGEEIKLAWSTAHLIMLDGINPALSKYMFAKYQDYLTQFSAVPVISLGDLTNEKMNQGLSTEQASHIGSYYNNAGRGNYQNMMYYLANNFLKLSKTTAKAAEIVPSVGLYHYNFPGQVTADEEVFYAFLHGNDKLENQQPVIAIGIHRSVVDYEQQQIVDGIIKGLEEKGAKAFGYFFEGEDQTIHFTELLMVETDQGKKPRVDLLINYRSLHFVDKRRGEFAKVGVPIIHALNYTEGDQLSFEKDNAGVSPTLTPFFSGDARRYR